MNISLFLTVKSSKLREEFQSDHTLVYQSILSGMLLLDAIEFTEKGTLHPEKSEKLDKKKFKKLYEEGIALLHSHRELYLFISNCYTKEDEKLRWSTSISDQSVVPVVKELLPSIAFKLNDLHEAEIHVTKDSANFIKYIGDNWSEGKNAETLLSKYFIDDNNDNEKEINCIEWVRDKKCGESHMQGWKYLSIAKSKLLESVYPKVYSFCIGDVIDRYCVKSVWITKVKDQEHTKYASFFPESLEDIRDIMFNIYRKGAIKWTYENSFNAEMKDLEDEYVASIMESLEVINGLSDPFDARRSTRKTRLLMYFNTFLSYNDKQEGQETNISNETSNNHNLKRKKMKDGMFGNMMEKFKSMIVPVTDPNLKITMDGNVAVRNGEGEYISINADNELVNYPADFTISVPIYVMKKPFASIQLGEIVKKGNSYAKVIGKNPDGTLKCLSFTGYTTTKKGITDFMLGASYADVVVNIMNIQNAGINPMMLALMNNDGNMSSKEMMMLMMMSGGMNGGGMNPMMLMLLAGDKGGDSSMSKMLEVMMMSQMFSGGNMNGMNNMFGNMGGMFGGQMPNPFQMFQKAGPKKPATEKSETEE